MHISTSVNKYKVSLGNKEWYIFDKQNLLYLHLVKHITWILFQNLLYKMLNKGIVMSKSKLHGQNENY